MLPEKRIRQADPFRLAQISPAEWNQGWTQAFRQNIWKANMLVFPYFNFLTVIIKIQFSVRTVFQSERVLNICNVVISGMKTRFYTQCMKSKYGRIKNTIIKFVIKNEYSLFKSFPPDGSISPVTDTSIMVYKFLPHSGTRKL